LSVGTLVLVLTVCLSLRKHRYRNSKIVATFNGRVGVSKLLIFAASLASKMDGIPQSTTNNADGTTINDVANNAGIVTRRTETTIVGIVLLA
jgi:hypothetical protein